ncbi:hypothetical protein J2X76_006072 [Neorhizobium sp. 2083]|uniref:hypothetical protein n=1 Tax=Neorhizobium sp. 2083 TaxID=2817762 RepID=UPI0028648061|nr:hypothetical protein [Neorhizobium sp. 2083]MDR6820872.1 hypothetical protein [Neorhizobium sp. 2083]
MRNSSQFARCNVSGRNDLRRQGHNGIESSHSVSHITLDPLVRAPLVKVLGAFMMSDLKPTNAARYEGLTMIADIAAWMFTLFVVDPLHAEMRQHLERASAPVEIVQQSRQCLVVQVPLLIEKAGNEPGWAIATVVGISTGWTSPERLFDGADPNCSALRGLIGAENAREAEG